MDASGKTLAVEAVANELGALLINISPSKLRGLFPGKQGPTKLVHLVFTVARYQPMAPVVIYLDDCEQFFQGGGKKAKTDKEGPARFAKVRGREERGGEMWSSQSPFNREIVTFTVF
jgi:ATP-dependent 26S proteasome regulatory subunit